MIVSWTNNPKRVHGQSKGTEIPKSKQENTYLSENSSQKIDNQLKARIKRIGEKEGDDIHWIKVCNQGRSSCSTPTSSYKKTEGSSPKTDVCVRLPVLLKSKAGEVELNRRLSMIIFILPYYL